VDYDPGASEVNQLNRIKLMLDVARKNVSKENEVYTGNIIRVPIVSGSIPKTPQTL